MEYGHPTGGIRSSHAWDSINLVRYFAKGMLSDERDAGDTTFGTHLVGPDTGLCLTDVCFVQQNHAEAALTYASADAERLLIMQETLVEEELLAFFFALKGKLAFEGIFINADAHGGELYAAIKQRVPY